MFDQNDTGTGTVPADADADASRSRAYWLGCWRPLTAALLAVALALLGGGTAHAGGLGLGDAPAEMAPPANAAFTHKGVPIYGHLAVGSTCQLLGFCGDAADTLRGERPRFLSRDGGQLVTADCQEGGATRIWGFLEGGGDRIQLGWVTRGLELRVPSSAIPRC